MPVSDQEAGPATLVALGNQQSRVTLSLTSGQRQEIRSGPAGVRIGPDGTPHALALHNCLVDAAWFFPALTLQALQTDTTLGAAYVGPVQWNGAAAIELQFFHVISGQSPVITSEIQALSVLQVYFDPATAEPLGLDFNAHTDQNLNQNIPVEIRFGNYQKVKGFLVPFRIQKFEQGGLALDLTVSQATVNSGVSPSTFILPAISTSTNGGAQ